MLTIKPLKTDRNTWRYAYLYDSRNAAEKDGYGLMYEDSEGTVFGIRSQTSEHCWDKIAFVPYERFVEKYNELATFEPEKYKGLTIVRTVSKKRYAVIDEIDWISGEDMVLCHRKTLEACRKYIDLRINKN